ncbi:MAG TPA: hypothetical protein VHY83_01965 [Solirubrobacteraceae bacterium]|jgi:hypothetical protein|nr:hypothetical protein [Solirubrobacteraceae bacterium]
MAGRPSRTAKASAPKISDATAAKAQGFLDREALLDNAVHAGVISEGMRKHYATAYDADPAGCRAFLGKLGLRTETTASTAEPEDAYPDSLLSPQERQRVAAAREGRQHSRIVS